MKPTTNTLANYAKVVNWVNSTISTTKATPVDRDATATLLQVPAWMVVCSLVVLHRKGTLSKASGKKAAIYVRDPNSRNMSAAQLKAWVDEYQKAAYAKKIDKQRVLPEVNEMASEPQPMKIDFNQAQPVNKSYQEGVDLLKKEEAKYNFGYIGPDGKYIWSRTAEEAGRSAAQLAARHGIDSIDIVQKVGQVVNQPTITFF